MNLESLWYGRYPLAQVLRPLSWIYRMLVAGRRLAYEQDWLRREALPVPVVVVGNLSVGGTGKTPLVLWLAETLRQRGYRPGLLIRGYGGKRAAGPRLVPAAGDPFEFGDEAVLLARRSGCPVAAGADRVAAGRLLLAQEGCDLLLCDDGLQHYRLKRDLEILVIDAARGFGNGYCLPAGPLREPQARARRFRFKIATDGPCPGGGATLRLEPGPLVNLRDPTRTRPLASFNRQRVTAVAGIGHPARFFALLRRFGLYLDERPYPDHHPFSEKDLASWPPGPVVMTEKDAVKCAPLAGGNCWYLPVTAVPEAAFEVPLFAQLKGLIDG